MNKLLLIIVFLFALTSISSQVTDTELIRVIRENDIRKFDNYFSQEKINDLYGDDSLTLLSYSLFYKSNDIVKYLLERDADINMISGGLTPVMWASRIGNAEGLKMLISKNARINETDTEGNSALIYAASMGCHNCVKVLIEEGADIYQVNSYGKDAEFYSRRAQHNEVTKTLRLSRIGMDVFIEDMTEGPHIEWLDDDKIRMTYFHYKSKINRLNKKSRKLRVKNDESIIEGLGNDRGKYPVQRSYQLQPSVYKGIDSIFIIGDVHGNYQFVEDILVNNAIISENKNWRWGNGHLVFIGDIFDKGDHVTEILWLIKKLEKQAFKEGGRVHLIYGNHEVMNLFGDDRYVSDKYLYLTEEAGIRYSELFSMNFDLGRWLRSLNTVIQINDILIVHAGISPEIIERQLSIKDINTYIHNYLHKDSIYAIDSSGVLLLGNDGPLWYRGYVMNLAGRERITEQEFNEIREFYNVNRIIFGHTPGERFRLMFKNRLIGLDVSESKAPGYEKALFIKSGEFYKVFSNGIRKKLGPE